MKLGNEIINKVEGSDFEGYDASISKANIGKMFAVVSKNMYRRPINSIVREITSNCFDSHIEAKIDDPVVITINSDEGGDYILFKDVGMGISPERMKNIYAKWFSSTKESTNDQIGMWGLGSKSPLAYTSEFYVTTVFDKKKYEYVVREGVDKPRIDFLLDDETEERNGTEVKIYAKGEDINKFIDACKKELLYFDNVYVDIALQTYFGEYENVYQIYEYETFKFRPNIHYNSGELHLILGKVAYPISWDELDIEPIYIPCGIQFQIGDLRVTPERESIRYIDIEVVEGSGEYKSTKDILLEKIAKFKEEIWKIYRKQYKSEHDNYIDYKRAINNNVPRIILGEEFISDKYQAINIESVVSKKERLHPIFLPLKNFKGKIPDNLFFQYSITKEYQQGLKTRDRDSTPYYDTLTDSICIQADRNVDISSKRLAYIYDFVQDLKTFSRPNFLLIQEDSRKLSLKKKLDYYEIKLSNNLDETNALQQYLLIENYIKSEFKRLTFPYEALVPTAEWLEAQKVKKNKEQNRTENSFLVYNYCGLIISDNKQWIEYIDLESYKGLIIYGFEQDEVLIRNFRKLFQQSIFRINSNTNEGPIDPGKVRLYKTAKKNEEYFLDFENAYYIRDFMGDNAVFKRFATAALLKKEGKGINLTGYIAKVMGNPSMDFIEAMKIIFPPVADAMEKLDQARENYGDIAYTQVDNPVSKEFFEQLVTLAREFGLYDKEMYESYNKIERYTSGLDLINHIVITKETIPHLVDFLKLKGKKVADQWLSLEEYEKDLIKESVAKAEYQCEVFDASEGFKDSGCYFYSKEEGHYGEKIKSYSVLTSKEASKITYTARLRVNILNLISNYNENYTKTISN